MTRKQRFGIFLASAFFIAQFASADIAIVKTAGVMAFDEARNGINSICFENKQEFNLLEDLSNQEELTNSLRAGNFSLIIAIGAQAATFVKANLPDKPLVFCLVHDPSKAGLKGDNITGVSMNVAVREQFAVLRTISGKIKRIGMIYTQPANDAIAAVAKSAADDENIQLVAVPIASSQDIQKAMTDLTGRADAIWIPPDPSLVSEEVIKYVGSYSLSKLLPCVGPGDRYVRSGAIFSFSVDPLESGKAAGEIANKILQGASPSKISIQTNLKPKIIVNTKAAGLLGLKIPQSVLDAASKIYQ